jgi:hypothetical protein
MTWIGSKTVLCKVPIIYNKDKQQTGDKSKPTNKSKQPKASKQTKANKQTKASKQTNKQKQANKQTKANKGVHTFFGSLLARRKSGAIIITNHVVW